MQAPSVGFVWEQLTVIRMEKRKNLFLVLIVETVVGLDYYVLKRPLFDKTKKTITIMQDDT